MQSTTRARGEKRKMNHQPRLTQMPLKSPSSRLTESAPGQLGESNLTAIRFGMTRLRKRLTETLPQPQTHDNTILQPAFPLPLAQPQRPRARKPSRGVVAQIQEEVVHQLPREIPVHASAAHAPRSSDDGQRERKPRSED